MEYCTYSCQIIDAPINQQRGAISLKGIKEGDNLIIRVEAKDEKRNSIVMARNTHVTFAKDSAVPSYKGYLTNKKEVSVKFGSEKVLTKQLNDSFIAIHLATIFPHSRIQFAAPVMAKITKGKLKDEKILIEPAMKTLTPFDFGKYVFKRTASYHERPQSFFHFSYNNGFLIWDLQGIERLTRFTFCDPYVVDDPIIAKKVYQQVHVSCCNLCPTL
eukprot:GHVL01018909.1.p1 GENE.GHVL01018909.1~~GHVL01018909.1.p1  ORF type:complete len:216 (+),score=50.16 GHVL01018909.1:19-666(+)